MSKELMEKMTPFILEQQKTIGWGADFKNLYQRACDTKNSQRNSKDIAEGNTAETRAETAGHLTIGSIDDSPAANGGNVALPQIKVIESVD